MSKEEARLKEIRREIAALLDEATLIAGDQPLEDREWIEKMYDLLEALAGC